MGKKMNILILGAGLMQKVAILSAKELGAKVCVIDADKNAIAIPFADEFKQIDLKDKEGILNYAKELQKKGGLKAVFTAGTDFSASVSYVCEKLGLKSHSFDSSCNASVKTLMRECFEKDNVPSPKFMKIGKENLSENLIDKVLQKMNFPFVVKPVDNMGARGCRMIRCSNEFYSSVKKAIECSRSGYAIIEEYMEGPEFSIDALIYKGSFTVTGFAVRHIKYPPYFIEIGHTMPAVLEKQIHDELISTFALGAKSLGLSCGAAKADIKYTKNGPMIGEIAGRLSGGYMSGWTYPYSSDLNLTKQALLIACGEEPSELLNSRIPVDFIPSKNFKDKKSPFEIYEIPSKRTCAERAWISIPGTVEYIENINEYTDKAIFDVLPRATVSLGSKVDFPRNNVEKCGNVISVSNNREIAIKSAEDAVSNIFITLKPNTKETDDFFNNFENDDEKDFPPKAFGNLSENEWEKISGVIEKNQKVQNQIPTQILNSNLLNKKDWNYNTILQTAQKFDILRPNHPKMDSKSFWKFLLKGGLQGAVYFCDSQKDEC